MTRKIIIDTDPGQDDAVATSNMGFGNSAVSGIIRLPRPAARIMAFIQ